MSLIFSLLLIISPSSAQDIPLEPKFAQQNQHVAYFFSGSNSLHSECSLATTDIDCHFEFEDESGYVDKFTVLYQDLASTHNNILRDLRALARAWDQEAVLTDLWGRLFLIRGYDREALQQLIQELEAEPLQERVLILKNDTRPLSAYFYSQKRAREIYSVFRKNLKK